MAGGGSPAHVEASPMVLVALVFAAVALGGASGWLLRTRVDAARATEAKLGLSASAAFTDFQDNANVAAQRRERIFDAPIEATSEALEEEMGMKVEEKRGKEKKKTMIKKKKKKKNGARGVNIAILNSYANTLDP